MVFLQGNFVKTHTLQYIEDDGGDHRSLELGHDNSWFKIARIAL